MKDGHFVAVLLLVVATGLKAWLEVVGGPNAVAECPEGSSSSSELSYRFWTLSCVANPGHFGPPRGPFEPCRAGTFQPDHGQYRCMPCGPGSSTSSGENPHGLGSIHKTNCVARRGWAGLAGGPFTKCARGTYQPKVGGTHCIKCSPGGTTQGPASQSKQQCISESGHGGPPGGPFEPCLRNYFADDVGSDCRACPPGSVSRPGSSRCKCARGFTLGDPKEPCRECQQGTYKSRTGSKPCTPCPDGQDSPSGSIDATACIQMPDIGLAARLKKKVDGIVSSVARATERLQKIAADFGGKVADFTELLGSSFAEEWNKSWLDFSWLDSFEKKFAKWDNASGDDDSDECPFSNEDEVLRCLQDTQEFKDLQSRDSETVKAAFKVLVLNFTPPYDHNTDVILILNFHPDKFGSRFQECDPKNSIDAPATVTGAVEELIDAIETNSENKVVCCRQHPIEMHKLLIGYHRGHKNSESEFVELCTSTSAARRL